MSVRFDARSPQDLADLIAGHPLAWVCCDGAGGLAAALLPLLPEWGPDGALVALEGHVPHAHPMVAALRSDPRALLLWLGPQGYVSPSWLADRTQAPSWTYASAQARVRVQFDEREGATEAHLRRLCAAHEAGRPQAWSPGEMGARLALLAARVVAFRAVVDGVHERYKLGQDERDDVFASQLAHLAGTPLAAWMQRFNPERGPRAAVHDPADAALARPSVHPIVA